MSAFANFKKRHQAKQAAEQGSNDKPAMEAPIDTNPALRLLAILFGTSEQEAIATAQEFIDSGARVVAIDPSLKGTDKTVVAEVTKDDDGNITDIKSDLQDSADTVNETAGTLNDAANDAAGSATELLNTTEDVADSAATIAEAAVEASQAAEDIKEVAEELKKSPEAPQSSPSEKSTKPNESSKK